MIPPLYNSKWFCLIELFVSEEIVLQEPLVQEAVHKVQWSRTQQYDKAVQRGVRFMQLAIQHNWTLDELNIALGYDMSCTIFCIYSGRNVSS